MAEKKESRKLLRIEIEPAENGGHTVTHHYRDSPHHSSKSGVGMSYTPPEHHVFGPHEGHEMLAHVANHLNVPEPEEKDENEEEGED